jgi:hypothetical protein
LQVETRFAEAHPVISQPDIVRAVCISLIDAFHDPPFAFALHPTNTKVEGLIACLHRLWSYGV